MNKSYICFGILIAVIVMASVLLMPVKNVFSQVCTDGGCEPGSRVWVCLKPGFQGDKAVTLRMGVIGAIKLHEKGMVDPGPCPEFSTDDSSEVISADILCDDPCLYEYEICLTHCDPALETFEICATECADANSYCVFESCNRLNNRNNTNDNHVIDEIDESGRRAGLHVQTQNSNIGKPSG